MKKIPFYIYTLFHHLFTGMKSADTIAFSQKTDTGGGEGGGTEVKDEADSVYKDLLRGEVTQAVKELRYETYHAERKSHDYVYAGGGRAVKRKYDDTPSLPCYEGYHIQVVQDNTEDTGGVVDGISNASDGSKEKKDYTIVIERDFTPRFKIEEFVNKIVVERNGTENVILDLYTTKYESQFNRRHRPFLNELKRIIDGDIRSEIIDFDKLKFLTYKAWGVKDLVLFSYCAVRFKEIREIGGDYVLSFDAIVNEDGFDLLKEFDDKIAEYKFEHKLPRDTKVPIDYATVLSSLKEDENVKDELEVLKQYKENGILTGNGDELRQHEG